MKLHWNWTHWHSGIKNSRWNCISRPFPPPTALTVVRIHIRAATFAPIASAPAAPPRTADLADFSIISLKVGLGGSSFAAVLIFVVLLE